MDLFLGFQEARLLNFVEVSYPLILIVLIPLQHLPLSHLLINFEKRLCLSCRPLRVRPRPTTLRKIVLTRDRLLALTQFLLEVVNVILKLGGRELLGIVQILLHFDVIRLETIGPQHRDTLRKLIHHKRGILFFWRRLAVSVASLLAAVVDV